MNLVNSILTDFPTTFEWQMSHIERSILIKFLSFLKPTLSLEVGTYRGGSLQVISKFSENVTSIDIDPTRGEALRPFFPNVEFLAGDSRDVIPSLIAKWRLENISPDFVLIDGGHCEEVVRADIKNILELIPTKLMVILLHDSFNPDCRKGMSSINWEDYPHVHEVDLDVVSGQYSPAKFDTAEAGSMWGGLAVAVLKPEKREEALAIQNRQQTVIDACLPFSSHYTPPAKYGFWESLIKVFNR